MLITNQTEKSFRSTFQNNLENSRGVKIASGYFGASEITVHKDNLLRIAMDGGDVRLIHGMGGIEGLNSNLKSLLLDLNDELSTIKENNGIFIFKKRFHGKMYLTEGAHSSQVLIGSSNFSLSGFETNTELNFNHSNQDVLTEARAFFDFLFNESVRINLFEFPDRGEAAEILPIPSELAEFTVDKALLARPHDFEVPLRITKASSLNLFLGVGRVNSAGLYTHRSFFEVELTIPKARWRAPLTDFVPNVIKPAKFNVITDNDLKFKVNFNRKSSSAVDMRPLHETGGDFMSSPRNHLGKYIKGKLMDAGVLSFGEPVTEDTLIEYGNSALKFHKLEDNWLYMSF